MKTPLLPKIRWWFSSRNRLANQICLDATALHIASKKSQAFTEVFSLLEDRDPCFWRDDEELTPLERACASIRRVFAEKQALERQLGCDCKDKI